MDRDLSADLIHALMSINKTLCEINQRIDDVDCTVSMHLDEVIDELTEIKEKIGSD